MTILKSVRFDAEVLNKLKEIAKDEKRTLSNLINKILTEFVEKQ